MARVSLQDVISGSSLNIYETTHLSTGRRLSSAMFSLPVAFAAVVSATLLGLSTCRTAKDDQTPTYETFCFWDRLSEWRPPPYNFKASDIPVELCNAVIYSHVTIDNKTGLLKLTSQELKLDSDARAKASSFFYNWIWLLPPHSVFAQIKQLKDRNPDLKIFLALGGPQEPLEKYWKYFTEIRLWRNTAASLAQWLRTYDFDGVVFDFFSGSATMNGFPPTWNQARLIQPFITEIKRKFLDYPQKWRIALTIPAFTTATHHLFDIKRLNDVVNFFILQTSDCKEFPRGAGLNITEEMDMTDIERAELLVQKGASRQSIVLDIPFSGQTYTATGSDRTTAFKGHSGPYAKKQSTLAFFEVCDHIKSGWKRGRYGEEDCSFLNLGNEYVAYEDEKSIQRKARIIMGRQYRGAAVRTIDLDDITGSCTRKSHLLKALRVQLDERSSYVHFNYHPPNTTGWNQTHQRDRQGLIGTFTPPDLTYASSRVNTKNDSTTPIPPTTMVQDETGQPQHPEYFLPGFYARTPTSMNVPLSTPKMKFTTKPPVPTPTPFLDATDKQPHTNTSSTKPERKTPPRPEVVNSWRSQENDTASAGLIDISVTAATMSEKQQTTKTTLSKAQQETTLLQKGYTTLPGINESGSSLTTVVAAVSTETSITTSTTKTVTNKQNNVVSSSLEQAISPTPNIPKIHTTERREEIPTSTMQNIFVPRTGTKLSTPTKVTIDYESITSQSVRDICESGDIQKLLPHETDCGKFYQCAHSIPHLKTCPPKTVFDTTWQVCNWPNLANRPECIL